MDTSSLNESMRCSVKQTTKPLPLSPTRATKTKKPAKKHSDWKPIFNLPTVLCRVFIHDKKLKRW